MATIKGSEYKALIQTEDAFRVTPDTPNAAQIKFSSFEFGKEPEYTDDDTIKEKALQDKPDYMDSVSSGTVSSILCLNDVGHWLKLLWGAPQTTDNGDGTFDHVYTLSTADRPSALVCLENATASKFIRWNGVMLNSMSFNLGETDQKVSYELMGCLQTLEGASWDVGADGLPKARACAKSGVVYDVDGASTLGEVSSTSINITNDLDGKKLVDGQEGYGQILLGQPVISGNASVLLTSNDSMVEHAISETSKPMTLVSKTRDGSAQMHIHLPAVMFKEPKLTVNSSAGIIQELEWVAHADGANVPTITLINKIAGY